MSSFRIAQPSLLEQESCSQPLVSPRQLNIEVINPRLACELNRLWHSRLPHIHWSNVVRNTHYVCFGAKYNCRRYAVGIWSSPVAQNRLKDGKHTLELRRLAISDDAPRNTASWMISRMVRIIAKMFPDMKKTNFLSGY
jgi:hypothetical protein